MENLRTDVMFLEPKEPQVFSGPFSIAWGSKHHLHVTEWMLLVGTEDGNWDIMSANTGERTRAAIDISDIRPLPRHIYARLRYAVYEEAYGQDRWYITLVPFEISKKAT